MYLRGAQTFDPWSEFNCDRFSTPPTTSSEGGGGEKRARVDQHMLRGGLPADQPLECPQLLPLLQRVGREGLLHSALWKPTRIDFYCPTQ